MDAPAAEGTHHTYRLAEAPASPVCSQAVSSGALQSGPFSASDTGGGHRNNAPSRRGWSPTIR